VFLGGELFLGGVSLFILGGVSLSSLGSFSFLFEFEASLSEPILLVVDFLAKKPKQPF
jgi:hypothetical protein